MVPGEHIIGGLNPVGRGEEGGVSQEGESQVERLCNGQGPDVVKTLQKDQGCWSSENVCRIERKEPGEVGRGQPGQGPVGYEKDLGFYP